MLGNRNNHASTWLERCTHALKCLVIFFDMLKHIKGANNIKLLTKGHAPGVHLQQGSTGQSGRRMFKTCNKNFASIGLHRRKLPSNAAQYKSRAAAYFQK